MPTLHLIANGKAVETRPLQPGSLRLGRNPDNDWPLDDPSISGHHCEVWMVEGQVLVRDLGSTNGTYVDGQPVSEAAWQPGQILHVGTVELHLSQDVAAAAKGPLRVSLAAPAPSAPPASAAPPPPPPPLAATKLPAGMRLPPRPRVFKGFYEELPEVYRFPFQGSGVIMLVTGSLFFSLVDFLKGFWTYMPTACLMLAVIGAGFMFSIMQRVITHSAAGDDKMPGWPEVSLGELVHPTFMLIMCFAVSFGPAMAVLIFGKELDPQLRILLIISLSIFGCLYLPMGILATAMYSSVMALNPMLVVVSIARIPAHYLVACAVLAVAVGARFLADYLLSFLPIPVLPGLISSFIALYLLMVEMRILGLLYRCHQNTLNWGT